MPEGGDLCESMRVIRSLAPPFRRFATAAPLQPRLLWLAGVFPGGSFHLPPPQITPTTHDGSHVCVASGPLLLEWVGNPRSPTPRSPAIELRPGSAHELLQFGPNQAGARAYNCPLAPDNLGGARSPHRGAAFNCRSYARGRALENVGGALPCLGFPLSGGDGPTLVGGRPPPPSLALAPPPSRLLGGEGHAAEGCLADDWPLGPPSRPPANDSGDSRRARPEP